ncbi:hypothetical protein NLX83_15615 [Allokutzneria sp. A3M-2-11 16]|uniref:hypothetical protein n=1 Tax=Allokutzneria sp. A3M-2-11 16 TaxID=2962043 RepID=UPI0020B74E90|nr:hypothetical protein [Allokutzneria sp. A3M-2-11 16]MCP3800695.1 hypothetical protein [Allokutzneria sp. A3M-2-11 16]
MNARTLTVPARGRAAATAAAIGLLLTVAACDSGSASRPVSTTTPGTPGSTAASTSAATPVETAKREAIAAYLGMWNDFVHAATTSDWQSPTLGRHATGTALSTLSRGLYADHYNGLVSKGSPTHNTEVSSVDSESAPSKVIVGDCSDSTAALKYRADTGQPANDGPGGRRRINATVQRQTDGTWRVTDFGVQAVGTC